MWLKTSRLPLWLGAVCGYAEGIDAFNSLDALVDAVIYALFVGGVLYTAGTLIPDR